MTEIIAEDSYLIKDFLPSDFSNGLFEVIKQEVTWNQMLHHGSPVPRLIAIQSQIENNKEPIYRHPSEIQPKNIQFTPNVELIRKILIEKAGQPNINHVLIQYYKDGDSNIGEHSDKTLDISLGAPTLVISLGSTRIMTLKKKIKTGYQHEYIRVAMPHGSLFVLGWKTNRKWYHSINKQKLSNGDVDPGERISLTFRTIATFKTNDRFLYGQGARCKTYEELMVKIKDGKMENIDDKKEEKDIYRAFGQENHDSDFDWNTYYGQGFDYLFN